VLVRPLGDVVVLMPPLTTTTAEIERVVDVLAFAIATVQDQDQLQYHLQDQVPS